MTIFNSVLIFNKKLNYEKILKNYYYQKKYFIFKLPSLINLQVTNDLELPGKTRLTFFLLAVLDFFKNKNKSYYVKDTIF